MAVAKRIPRNKAGHATHEMLLDAALTSFARAGYLRGTVRAVVNVPKRSSWDGQKTGMSLPTFHYYFKSKQALFERVVRQTLHSEQEMLQRVSKTLQGQRLQRMKTLVSGIFHWAKDDLRRPGLILQTLGGPPLKELSSFLKEQTQMRENAYHAALSTAVSRRVVGAAPTPTTLALTGILDQHLRLALRMNKPADLLTAGHARQLAALMARLPPRVLS